MTDYEQRLKNSADLARKILIQRFDLSEQQMENLPTLENALVLIQAIQPDVTKIVQEHVERGLDLSLVERPDIDSSHFTDEENDVLNTHVTCVSLKRGHDFFLNAALNREDDEKEDPKIKLHQDVCLEGYILLCTALIMDRNFPVPSSTTARLCAQYLRRIPADKPGSGKREIKTSMPKLH